MIQLSTDTPSESNEGRSEAILAPLFLWPISIESDRKREGRLLIRRAPEEVAGSPQFNSAMQAWVRRQLNELEVLGPSTQDLSELTFPSLQRHVLNIAAQFQDFPPLDLGSSLVRLPVKEARQHRGAILNAGFLGYVRWQNEAILADLDAISSKTHGGPLVDRLISGSSGPETKSSEPPEHDRYIVTDADFSQQQAIWASRLPPGIIVRGPPGTGKSQTIVNIIADALGHGRRVLMICQKQTATHVVFERIRRAGLEKLCLEVHDAEQDRQHVFQSVRQQVDDLAGQPQPRTSSRRDEVSTRISQLEQELDDYASALRSKDATLGASYKDVFGRHGRIYASFPSVRVIPSLESATLNCVSNELQALLHRTREVGHLFQAADALRNPWQNRTAAARVGPALEMDLRTAGERLRELDSAHQDHVLTHGLGLPLASDLVGLRTAGTRLLEILTPLAHEPQSLDAQATHRWLLHFIESPEVYDQSRARVDAGLQLASEVGRTGVAPEWIEKVGPYTTEELAKMSTATGTFLRLCKRWWRFLSFSFWSARRTIIAQLSGCSAEQVDSFHQAIHGTLHRRQLANVTASLVPGLSVNGATDAALVRFARTAADAFNRVADLVALTSSVSTYLLRKLSDMPTSWSAILTELRHTVERARILQALSSELSTLRTYLQTVVVDDQIDQVHRGHSLKPFISTLIEGHARLNSLIALEADRERRTGRNKRILDALEQYERERATERQLPSPPTLQERDYGNWWEALTECAALTHWLRHFESTRPVLRSMVPSLRDAKVTELKSLLQEKRGLETDQILDLWRSKQATHTEQPWKRIFQLRNSKNAEAKRLREAVATAVDCGLLDLRPCWLMSPSAAAQILPLREGLFDLVIFDEASQCPVEQALPALYRARTAVISGDEKQLPPTSFFANATESEEAPLDEASEEGDDAIGDAAIARDRKRFEAGEAHLLAAEALLDAAQGAFPERDLLVHYRSDRPELIAFSNHAFYNGKLEVAPAKAEQNEADGASIEYIDVAGCYERRMNIDEATRVVDVIAEIWKRPMPPTIGVITFNTNQRDLIEDRLKQRGARDAAFRDAHTEQQQRRDHEQDVGFFVKNLENVQGDERDVIVFSTTFGKNSEGRFFRRFGPVGQKGGERRLNVAITRAKSKVYIVSSMPLSEIAPATTQGLSPAGYLQAYLEYASAVSAGHKGGVDAVLAKLGRGSAEPSAGSGETESPLEEEVREVVERLGFRVESQVGESGFRIDLAVVDPRPNHGYALAIECDGAAYHADRSARLRDVWRQGILESRGWKVHRIWSTSWWTRRDEEIRALTTALSEARAHLPHSQVAI